MRILGIDPGTAIVGFSIVDYENKNITLIDYGCIFTEKKLPIEERLFQIYKQLEFIIKKYSPQHMAVEELFYFKNNKTVISVGEARGVILLAGQKNNLKIQSYTPLQVKIGITGYGRSEKKQVQLMVKNILKLKCIPTPDDAADAIAIAITHINSLNNSQYKISSPSTVSTKNFNKNKISAKEFQKIYLKK